MQQPCKNVVDTAWLFVTLKPRWPWSPPIHISRSFLKNLQRNSSGFQVLCVAEDGVFHDVLALVSLSSREVEGDDAVLPGPGAYEAYVRDVATAKLSSKRVAIAESDSDEEDEVEAPPPQKPASKRVAIAESDSDGEGSDAKPSSNPSVHVRQPPAPSTKRVPITESDSDEEPARQVAESSSSKRVAIVESDSDEENVPAPAPVAPAPAPAKVQPPPVPIVSPKPKSQGPRVTGPQSHRVEILSDSDSDEEPLPPVASKPAPVLPPVPSVPPTPPSPTLNVAKAVELKASGNAKFSVNDYAGAIADYSSALLICPSQPGILSNRAMALMKQEKHGAALADCVEGLSVLDALESGKERVDAALMPPPGIRVKVISCFARVCVKVFTPFFSRAPVVVSSRHV